MKMDVSNMAGKIQNYLVFLEDVQIYVREPVDTFKRMSMVGGFYCKCCIHKVQGPIIFHMHINGCMGSYFIAQQLISLSCELIGCL